MKRLLFIAVTLCFILISCESQAKNIRIRSGISFQEQLTEANAVYLIKERIDLNGATVIMPPNSTLKFKRKGQLANGTLQGDGTHFTGKPSFDGVLLKGKYTTKEFYTSWNSARSMSDYIEDVMNLGGESAVVVDCDITLKDQKKNVDHLNLKGKKKTITNSDRYYITCGGTSISDLKFRWDKGPVQEPKENYRAVIIYSDILTKDTTVVVNLNRLDIDGGQYCSYFMRQAKSGLEPSMRINNTIRDCHFSHLTMGAIWTCGGTGSVTNSHFTDIGYDQSTVLHGVTALRLGYNNTVQIGKAIGYKVENCRFENIVAPYSDRNDGRGLHALLVYGDSTIVRNNTFRRLTTDFTKPTETGMDAEILYFKGSWNVIENNYFEDGAGSASDAVVTLKSIDSEGNVIRNNRFMTTVTDSKFIYVAGKSVEIEGNEFRNISTAPGENIAYAIYLGHHNENSGNEIAWISNNSFSFPHTSNYMAVYANRWGNLYVVKNNIKNPQRILKVNNREGELIIKNNVIYADGLGANTSNVFIEISSGGAIPAQISDNEFGIKNVVLGKLVQGSNYVFDNNKVNLVNVNMQSFLGGSGTNIKAVNNTIEIDKESTIIKRVLIGEKSSSKIIIKGNTITGASLSTVL